MKKQKQKNKIHLLVKFEGVAKCVQAFGLLRVGVSKGLRRGFEEVLVVTHLGYWHTVELVCGGRVWTKIIQTGTAESAINRKLMFHFHTTVM